MNFTLRFTHRKVTLQMASADKQQKFFECPECSSIVERVYQHGICRNCLNNKLQAVRLIINRHHALKDARMA